MHTRNIMFPLIHVYVQCSHLSVWHMAIYAISAANSALFISLSNIITWLGFLRLCNPNTNNKFYLLPYMHMSRDQSSFYPLFRTEAFYLSSCVVIWIQQIHSCSLFYNFEFLIHFEFDFNMLQISFERCPNFTPVKFPPRTILIHLREK